jgi:hypothetical protein
MSNPTIDFRTSMFFPVSIIVTGAILLLIGILALAASPIVSVITIAISVVILTTEVRFEVDFSAKKCREYIRFLGFRYGKSEPFAQLDNLFIKKGKVSQQMHSRSRSNTIYKVQYEGYLRYNGEVMFHLFSDDKKLEVRDKLKLISGKLNLQVIDLTNE